MNELGFGVYFTTDKQTVRLPVNPSEITVSYPGDNTQYNLIDLGEAVIPRNPKLATVTLDSFFPRNAFVSGTVSDAWYKPEFYVNFFTMLMRKKAIFQLIINRYDGPNVMFDSSFEAVVSDFEITDKGGEAGDVYFKLSVQEYRNTEPQTVEKIKEEDDTTYLAQTKQREIGASEFVPGDMVVVTGPVFLSDDMLTSALKFTKKYLTKAKGVVQRVLPPSAQPEFNKLYITGMGWVNKTDCIKGNADNTVQRLQQEYGDAIT